MSGAKILILLILLAVASLAVQTSQGDVSSYVFVEFNPGDYFPYLVEGSGVSPAPVVYIMTPKDVIVQDLGINATVYVPQGVYLAVPRSYFRQRPPPVPRGVGGRVVDIYVEGLGIARVVLARNSTEIPNAVAIYVYLDAEERRDRFYYRGIPLDVRRPAAIEGLPSGASIGSGEITPMYVTSTSSNTAVSSWARYVFNPASPAKVRNAPGSQYTPIRYFNATGFANNDFVVGVTNWAYLGYGVSDVYVAFYGPSSNTVRYYLCPLPMPTPAPPASLSQCASGAAAAPISGKMYLVKINTAAYSSQYLWFYAEIYNPSDLPVNASIAAVYVRPAPWDGSVYSLLTANWLSSVGQPGYTFSADYGYGNRVARILFSVRVPPGAQMPINIAVKGLTVYTCSSSPTLTVKIYSLADPSSAITAAGQKSVSTACGPYVFGDIYGTLPESAVAPLLAANSTAIPLVLEFNPPLYASYPETVKVSFASLYAYGQRWPEIWRQDAYNWISDTSFYAYIQRRARIVARDYLAFSVWPSSHYPYNETSPWSSFRAQAYVSVVSQAGATLGNTAPPEQPRISYQYVSVNGNTQLTKVCVALEASSNNDGKISSVSIRVVTEGSNPLLEAFASVASGVLGAINNAVTFYALLGSVFGLPGVVGASVMGYVTWGLGIFIQLAVPTSNTYKCNPGNWMSDGYSAGTGYIKGATWDLGVAPLPPYSGGLKVRISALVESYFASSNPIGPSDGVYADFFSYVVYNTNYFPGPLERYGLGITRYYIKIN
ncbi:MAG: hypothetical protein ACP5I3_11445 [Thermoproteus sp.]